MTTDFVISAPDCIGFYERYATEEQANAELPIARLKNPEYRVVTEEEHLAQVDQIIRSCCPQ